MGHSIFTCTFSLGLLLFIDQVGDGPRGDHVKFSFNFQGSQHLWAPGPSSGVGVAVPVPEAHVVMRSDGVVVKPEAKRQPV